MANPWYGRNEQGQNTGSTGFGGGSHVVNVTAVGQIFVCEICGNVVEVKEVGGGELVCCGEPMVLRT
jgi:desulfoferrodoxin-like iron-binding protein